MFGSNQFFMQLAIPYYKHISKQITFSDVQQIQNLFLVLNYLFNIVPPLKDRGRLRDSNEENKIDFKPQNNRLLLQTYSINRQYARSAIDIYTYDLNTNRKIFILLPLLL